jgi:hypothetical protein
MKQTKWDPRPFARILDLPRSPAARRAYYALRDLNGTSQKNRDLLREWEIFVGFSDAVGFDIDVSKIEMLDPNISTPPPPDLQCPVHGEMRQFELAEIVQQDIAKFSKPRKTRRGADIPSALTEASKQISQRNFSIADPWETFCSILGKKAKKSYQNCGRPLSLLLYYHQSDPYWQVLGPLLDMRRRELNSIIETSHFDSVWVFDSYRREVLWHLSHSEVSGGFGRLGDYDR